MFEIILRRSSLSDDAEKASRELFRGRQRQPVQVHASLMNAYHQDHACHARIGASSPASAARRTDAPSGGRW